MNSVNIKQLKSFKKVLTKIIHTGKIIMNVLMTFRLSFHKSVLDTGIRHILMCRYAMES